MGEADDNRKQPHTSEGGPTAPAPRAGGGSRELVALARRALAPLGLELVQLVHRKEGRRWVLRLFIDRTGGVTLDDCARASDQFGAVLEATDIVAHSYTLEVSSPGLDRPLVTEDDYRRFAGRRARITTHRPLDGRRHFTGTLAGLEAGCVALRLGDGPEVSIPFDSIASARLEIDLDNTP